MKLVTAKLFVQAIEKGMVIVEYSGYGGKPGRIEVKEVVHSACSSRGTHVNKQACYSAHAEVDVLVGTTKSPDEMSPRELLEYMGWSKDKIDSALPLMERSFELHKLLPALAIRVPTAAELPIPHDVDVRDYVDA